MCSFAAVDKTYLRALQVPRRRPTLYRQLATLLTALLLAVGACTGILFTDAVGLPNWVVAGAAVDRPLPLPTLIGIEVILFALLELKRYEGWKKTGKVHLRSHIYQGCGHITLIYMHPKRDPVHVLDVASASSKRFELLRWVSWC